MRVSDTTGITPSRRGRKILLASALVFGGSLAGWTLSSLSRRAAIEQSDLDLARAAISRNDLVGAAAIADALLAKAPTSGGALALKADVARLRGDYNTARTSYLMAAAQEVSLRVDARLKLFDLTLGIGAWEEAAHHLRQLERFVGPDDVRVHSRRAVLERSPAALTGGASDGSK